MKPETAQMLLKVLDHPITKTVNYATIGSGLAGLASSLITRFNNEDMTDIMSSKDNLVPTKEYVAKYSPGTSVISSHEDIDNSKDYNALEKFLLKRMIPGKVDQPWKNYYNRPSEGGLVLAPEMSNKYLLGHELGHIRDLKDDPPKIYPFSKTIRNLTGEAVNMEERGWDNSPTEMDQEGERVKDIAISPYKHFQKYIKIGFGLGALAGASKAFGPKILELIRSGNVR